MTLKTKSYEIWTSRFDVPPERCKRFSCSSDDEAIQELERIKNLPSMEWERLELIEVITERTIRKIAP